jgi:diguanylate cyclase (GGDEF)-like protein
MLDLDNFKRVNDTLGHAAGDRVITETAAIIRRRFDDQFLIGRIGGDEFAVFRTSAVWSAKDLEKTVQLCMDGLYAEFDRVFEEERARCSVSVSAGCVCTAKGFYSFEDLYELADRMLYKSKHNGKNELNSCCISEEDVTEFMRMEKGGEQT